MGSHRTRDLHWLNEHIRLNQRDDFRLKPFGRPCDVTQYWPGDNAAVNIVAAATLTGPGARARPSL